MPETLTQSERFARLVTPLGKDVLLLTALDGTEAISRNFEWRIGCLLNYDEDPVEPKKIIGKPCHVEVDTPAGETRYFHGLCTELRLRGWQDDFLRYDIVLRPWSWLLTRETRCEIFHDMPVDEIISKIFSKRGFTDYELQLTKTYQPLHYCVQYQETTFDFISRQMEKFGLFFYFKYSESKHVLVVVDDQNSLPDISAYDGLRFQPYSEAGIFDERLLDWQTENRLWTAVVDVDDYNYEKPNTRLEKTGKAKDDPQHGYNKQTHYRYPAGHLEPGEGQLLADIFVDAERAGAERKFAHGYAPLIHAGGVFKLADHPVDAENDRHFAVVARHSISMQPYRSGSGGGRAAADSYDGGYEVVEAAKAYKTVPATPWPRVHGAQTALVIKEKNAPDDEEIDVDDQGRILVRFHWNDTAEDSQCSCRVRVAQPWAGPQWGAVWIPRVGMEVVVEFLNGDPDRPLVTGTVYNGNNKPPIDFPANKTQSTLKSNSSKGGKGSNEFRFEDKKGNEEVYIHAERDRRMNIEHDDDITIGNDQTVKIGGSRTFELTGGDETITLKGAPGTTDKYGKSIAKDGNRTTTLEMGDETLKIAMGSQTTEIDMGDQTTKLGMGNQTTLIKMGDQTTQLDLGNQSTKMAAGKGTVQAMQSYEIKVGGSSIKLDPMSITLKAPMIKIDASMMLDAKGGITAKVEGGAMLTLKGGIVMIN